MARAVSLKWAMIPANAVAVVIKRTVEDGLYETIIADFNPQGELEFVDATVDQHAEIVYNYVAVLTYENALEVTSAPVKVSLEAITDESHPALEFTAEVINDYDPATYKGAQSNVTTATDVPDAPVSAVSDSSVPSVDTSASTGSVETATPIAEAEQPAASDVPVDSASVQDAPAEVSPVVDQAPAATDTAAPSVTTDPAPTTSPSADSSV